MAEAEVVWHKVAEVDELPEGRVKTVVAGRKSLALTRYEGAYGALDNHCPHQGGPLGEGSIENGLLNNAQLGKISKEQRAAEWDVWQTSLHNPNFSEYARVCGAHGVRVSEVAQLDAALAAAFAHDGPALVEVMTDPELV